MNDLGVGDVGHGVVVAQPAVAEFSILSSAAPDRGVETVDVAKSLLGDG